MAAPTDPLAELKKIADIKFDRERHRLTAINEELTKLDNERKALRKQIVDLANARETSPAALINTQYYLQTLSEKSRQLDEARLQASQRTEAQRQKIRTALASKIRVDDMGEK